MESGSENVEVDSLVTEGSAGGISSSRSRTTFATLSQEQKEQVSHLAEQICANACNKAFTGYWDSEDVIVGQAFSLSSIPHEQFWFKSSRKCCFTRFIGCWEV
mmetsp:Transcript_26309/g.32867  ORF Transcript_26309/g.32867 Transcript_26309/m.32867 type:complete len:103 (+) Transcript_26309:1-309(+)